jgi:hypothetical protein
MSKAAIEAGTVLGITGLTALKMFRRKITYAGLALGVHHFSQDKTPMYYPVLTSLPYLAYRGGELGVKTIRRIDDLVPQGLEEKKH